MRNSPACLGRINPGGATFTIQVAHPLRRPNLFWFQVVASRRRGGCATFHRAIEATLVPLPSFLSQQQINHPTPPDVLPRLAAVREDVGVVAARFFKGIGENGQVAEAPP